MWWAGGRVRTRTKTRVERSGGEKWAKWHESDLSADITPTRSRERHEQRGLVSAQLEGIPRGLTGPRTGKHSLMGRW